MDWNQVEGNWKQVKGKVKAQYSGGRPTRADRGRQRHDEAQRGAGAAGARRTRYASGASGGAGRRGRGHQCDLGRRGAGRV